MKYINNKHNHKKQLLIPLFFNGHNSSINNLITKNIRRNFITTTKELKNLLKHLKKYDNINDDCIKYYINQFYYYTNLNDDLLNDVSELKITESITQMQNISYTKNEILNLFLTNKNYIQGGKNYKIISNLLKEHNFSNENIKTIFNLSSDLIKHSNTNNNIGINLDLFSTYFTNEEYFKFIINFGNSLYTSPILNQFKLISMDIFNYKDVILDNPKDFMYSSKKIFRRINYLNSNNNIFKEVYDDNENYYDINKPCVKRLILKNSKTFNHIYNISNESLIDNFSYIPKKFYDYIIENKIYEDDINSLHSKIFIDQQITDEEITHLYSNIEEYNEELSIE